MTTITAKDLYDTVMISLAGKNPENGMKLKPRDKRIKHARVRLEQILEWANDGMNASQSKGGNK